MNTYSSKTATKQIYSDLADLHYFPYINFHSQLRNICHTINFYTYLESTIQQNRTILQLPHLEDWHFHYRTPRHNKEKVSQQEKSSLMDL